MVQPTVKQYSLGCRIMLTFQDPNVILDIVYVLVFFGIVLYIVYLASLRQKYAKMYNYLK